MQAIVFPYVNKDDSHYTAMGYLVENESILWGNNLEKLNPDDFTYPIIGYMIIEGIIKYKCIINDILKENSEELLQKFKPSSWLSEEYKNHLMISKIHPYGPFEISTFRKTNGETLKEGFYRYGGYSKVIEKGKEPLLNREEIKNNICSKYDESYTFNSLHDRNSHSIISISEESFKIIYNTDKSNKITITYDDLYSIYTKLYDLKSINNNYMMNNWNNKDLLPHWKHWHAPGSAILAELPIIDMKIKNINGTLKINNE